MSETGPSKEFEANSQGRKNNNKDGASELAWSHSKRGALSLSALTLEYNLILALVLHASRLFLRRLFSHLPLSNRGSSQFGSADTARKCQTPGVSSDQLTARRAGQNPSPQELLVTC